MFIACCPFITMTLSRGHVLFVLNESVSDGDIVVTWLHEWLFISAFFRVSFLFGKGWGSKVVGILMGKG